MVAPNDESVEYTLLLNARQALAELQTFNKSAIESSGAVESLQARLVNFERVVAAEANKAGVAFERQLEAFEKLNAAMMQLQGGKGNGVLGGQEANPFGVVQQIHDENLAEKSSVSVSSEEEMAAARAAMAQAGYNVEVDKTTQSQKKLADESKKAGDEGEKGANKSLFATRAWNIAVGMLIHQGINLLITALQSMFTMALRGLREMETATYNLVNAERNLSNQGINITPQGLDESIKNLQKLDPLLSKIQATEAVSRVGSLVAPAVGLNAKEIDQLTQSIAILAVKNKGLGKSFEEVESQISNAFLSGRVSVGINQLGVKITDQIVKDEALRLGLVRTADEYDKLTGKMQANIKARAMLSVISQSTNKDVASLPQFFDTVDAKITIFQSRLQDFFTQLGTAFAPLLSRVLDYLITALQNGIIWIEKNKGSLLLLADVLGNVVVIVLKLVGAFLKFGNAAGLAFKGALEGLQKLIDKIPFLKQIAQLLNFKGIGDYQDTPTGTGGDPFSTEQVSKYGARYAEAVAKAEQEVSQIMLDNQRKQEDLARDHQNKLADLARDAARKMADIARSLADKNADANRDYGNKVVDINSDYDKKIVDAKQESYKKAVDAEKKYQDELKNLRDKYLMDLEEALHARDARAILKLMQQYKLDKDKALENRNKEAQSAKTEAAQKVKDLEKERKEKLLAAQKDLADKLRQNKIAADRERRDAQIAAARALSDARQAYQRQLAEQRLFLQRKLADLADAIAQEYKLTAAGAAAISKIINSTAGTSSGTTTTSTSQPAIPYSVGSNNIWNSGQSIWGNGGLAEGGTFVATRPGTINVGENRPEVITATPLGKPGKDISKVFTNATGGSGMGDGKIEIGMSLSPDLEARIISQTLSETANVVLRINRSKQ